jgi:hypothetical protein
MQILIHNIIKNASLTDYLSSILKQTSNIHSLRITYIHIEEPSINIHTLCSVIPRSVKHLQIPITNINEMKSILENLNQLLSVTFYSANILNFNEEIKKWIQLKRKNSIYQEGVRCIQIWLGILVQNDKDRYSMKKALHRFYPKQMS